MARGKDKGYRVRAIVRIRVAAELISVISKFGPTASLTALMSMPELLPEKCGAACNTKHLHVVWHTSNDRL